MTNKPCTNWPMQSEKYRSYVHDDWVNIFSAVEFCLPCRHVSRENNLSSTFQCVLLDTATFCCASVSPAMTVSTLVAVGQVQRTTSIWSNVRLVMVGPTGRLRQREDNRTLQSQQRQGLLIFLQVSPY